MTIKGKFRSLNYKFSNGKKFIPMYLKTRLRSGVPVINLYDKSGNYFEYRVADLIARTFLPTHTEHCYLIYLDYDETNISVENLRLVSYNKMKDHLKKLTDLEKEHKRLFEIDKNKLILENRNLFSFI